MAQYIHEDSKHIRCMNKIRQAYRYYFRDWPWEIHITLQLSYYVPFGTANKLAKLWIRSQRHRFKHLRFAGFILLSNRHYEKPHIHILLTSDQTYPRTLSTLQAVRLKLIESSWNKGSCKITTFRDWDNNKITNYLTKEKNISLHNPDNWDIYSIRPTLLLRLKRGPSNTGC
jgi:hypothetical protein